MASPIVDGALPSAVVDRQRILLVDDEPDLRRMVRQYLEAEGFAVSEACDGDSALRELRGSSPDLILLDVAMPAPDGFEVLRRLRRTSDVPVIMLTARAEEIDRVVGLSMGADDYVTKPFSPRELVARVRAVLRRQGPGRADLDELLRFDGLTVDMARREVTKDGSTVDLTTLEFDLLAGMASAPGRVFTRAQLLEKVWGWDYFGPDRVVDVHIGNVRKKLRDNAAAPLFIATVRGVGYKFVAAQS